MIDDGNDKQWLPPLEPSLAQFRQGTLVARPPFFYYASLKRPIWQASKLADEGAEDEITLELDEDDRPPYGIVTSQSCDVYQEEDATNPWVQLAPVYPLQQDDLRLSSILNWKVFYLAPVTSLGDLYVADLRIELPIEKGWLSLQTPVAGFKNQEEYDKFSRFCGRNRNRPALADSIYTEVHGVLKQFLTGLRKTNTAAYDAFVGEVDHLFLAIAGDKLEPTAVQLVFVSEAPLTAELAAALEAWWNENYVEKTTSLSFLPPRRLTYDQVPFRELRAWEEVDLSRLAS